MLEIVNQMALLPCKAHLSLVWQKRTVTAERIVATHDAHRKNKEARRSLQEKLEVKKKYTYVT